METICNKENIGKMFRILFRNRYERKKLKNKEFSILCNTCIGGVIYHDLGEKFLSPTVNLYIRPHDFVKLMENLPYYLNECSFEEMKEIEEKLCYPVGRLNDILIFFKHYKSFDEAVEKWGERKNRIDYNNMFVIMTDRWCCPEEDLKRFDELPYKHKICFVAKKRDYPTNIVVEKGSNGYCVGTITQVQNIFGKRLYQYAADFDYIEWLNLMPDQ